MLTRSQQRTDIFNDPFFVGLRIQTLYADFFQILSKISSLVCKQLHLFLDPNSAASVLPYFVISAPQLEACSTTLNVFVWSCAFVETNVIY